MQPLGVFQFPGNDTDWDTHPYPGHREGAWSGFDSTQPCETAVSEFPFPPGFRFREPHFDSDINKWVMYHELGIHFGATRQEVIDKVKENLSRFQNKDQHDT